MKKYFESRLRVAEQNKTDLLIAIEECKDPHHQTIAYLDALWFSFEESFRVLQALQHIYKDDFNGIPGVYKRFDFLRMHYMQWYGAYRDAIDVIFKWMSPRSIDDLPF